MYCILRISGVVAWLVPGVAAFAQVAVPRYELVERARIVSDEEIPQVITYELRAPRQ